MTSGIDPLVERVRNTILRYDLLAPGEQVMVALSGGPDSVCLLHVLHTMGYHVAAAHLDHQTRAGASSADADWVRGWTTHLGVPCHIRRQPVAEEACAAGRSFEEYARTVRYAFLAGTARANGCTALATGHHAGDQAETVLMRLLRGTSGQGIAGIPYRRDHDGIRIVRPLLDCGRDMIQAYLQRHALTWRTDASNADERYARNRVRHRLLPTLAREYNPHVGEALSRLAALLYDDAQLLNRLAMQEAESCDIAGNRLNRKQFARVDRALQGRVLLTLAWRNGATCPYDRIREAVAFVCEGGTGLQLDLGAGVRLRNGRTYAYIETQPQTQAEVSLANPGTTRAGDSVFLVSPPSPIEPRDWRAYCSPTRQVFDADALLTPLAVRRWKSGDRFVPFGMNGVKKLQDYFVDAGISVPERRTRWLLLGGNRIAWIVGNAIDAHVAVTPHTRHIVEVEVIDARDPAD